ncbi:GreA/GreB family elongation factor [Vibrio neonatus]|uniref:GreA/GreB family elongation factor n=1 Tax=Vibrio neonatus TaxID=278860 RepID=UPI0021C275EC|nr:GreA/GreB family elongation factor [Vibrio neonatus]
MTDTPLIDKEPLRQDLLQVLHAQRLNALKAADSAHGDATHEQSVAETQYDTVAIEAAYLAHGQSQRVADCDAMISCLNSLVLRDFDDLDEISLGAIVTLDNGMTCWLLPVCGGFKVDNDKLVVITPQSPLGQMINGAEVGDTLANGRTITDLQ